MVTDMEYELYHHGIKGQKWGVRRYQNPDGSLTEAGAKRYGYGSVSVKRNERGDADSYVISNKSKRMEVSRQSLRSLEEEADSAYRQAIAFYNDVSMRKVDKFMKKHPETIENGNKVVDQYMEEKLTDLLNRYGEDVGGSSSKSSGSSKQSSSTKTSAPKESSDHSETAIFDKAYAALEKKYPNFDKMSEDRQDELLFDYLEKSGLLDEL